MTTREKEKDTAMRGFFLVCVASVLWGTTGIANSLMSVRTVDPALIGLGRTVLGALSLLVVAEAMRLPWAGRLPLLPLAAFGLAGAVFQVCLFAAFVQVGVTVTVMVTVCAPVLLMTMLDALRQRRRPEIVVAAALGIATLGVMLTLVGKAAVSDRAHGMDLHGNLLLATASVAFVVVARAAAAMARVMHPLRATGLGLGVTACVLALVVLCSPQADFSTLGGLPAGDMAILAYTGAFATGGAYLAFVLGMRQSRSAALGLAATLIEPAVAALLASMVLGERLGVSQMAGCLLILGAMIALSCAEQRANAGAGTMVGSCSPRGFERRDGHRDHGTAWTQ